MTLRLKKKRKTTAKCRCREIKNLFWFSELPLEEAPLYSSLLCEPPDSDLIKMLKISTDRRQRIAWIVRHDHARRRTRLENGDVSLDEYLKESKKWTTFLRVLSKAWFGSSKEVDVIIFDCDEGALETRLTKRFVVRDRTGLSFTKARYAVDVETILDYHTRMTSPKSLSSAKSLLRDITGTTIAILTYEKVLQIISTRMRDVVAYFASKESPGSTSKLSFFTKVAHANDCDIWAADTGLRRLLSEMATLLRASCVNELQAILAERFPQVQTSKCMTRKNFERFLQKIFPKSDGDVVHAEIRTLFNAIIDMERVETFASRFTPFIAKRDHAREIPKGSVFVGAIDAAISVENVKSAKRERSIFKELRRGERSFKEIFEIYNSADDKLFQVFQMFM